MSKFTIQKKREDLAIREAKILEELDTASDIFQSKGKKILMISLVSGVVVLSAYGLFSLISKKPDQPIAVPEKQKTKKVKKKPFSLKRVLMERATSLAVNYIGQELNKAMSRSQTKD